MLVYIPTGRFPKKLFFQSASMMFAFVGSVTFLYRLFLHLKILNPKFFMQEAQESNQKIAKKEL